LDSEIQTQQANFKKLEQNMEAFKNETGLQIKGLGLALEGKIKQTADDLKKYVIYLEFIKFLFQDQR